MISKIKKLLYIYQLSEYDNQFFLNWVNNHPDLENYLKLENKHPTWTFKARLIFALSIFFCPLYFISYKLLFYSLIFCSAVIKLPETAIIYVFIQRVKLKLKKHKDLIKIGITGSYGKTTTKEYLDKILSSKFLVLKSPENINTLLGLAKLILKELNKNHQILIVEMAAYKRGDIKKICRMIKPEIRILTGIDSQHLERFGSLENIIKTKFEILDGLTKDKNLIFLNSDNSLVFQNYKNFLKIKPKFYGLNPEVQKIFETNNIEVSEEGLKFDIIKGKEFYFNAEVKVFGRHQIEPILAVISVADKLGFTKKEILDGLKNLKPLPRRLFLTKISQGVTIIDDSYNISSVSFRAALEFLRESFTKERKIVITAGVVEQGEQKTKVNITLGQELKKTANLILIAKNSNTPYLLEGLAVSQNEILEYNKISQIIDLYKINKKVVLFNNAKELDANFFKILKPNDVVLIFPYDLPAHYY